MFQFFPHESWSSVFVRPIKSSTWSHPRRWADLFLFYSNCQCDFWSSIYYITVLNTLLLSRILDISTQTFVVHPRKRQINLICSDFTAVFMGKPQELSIYQVQLKTQIQFLYNNFLKISIKVFLFFLSLMPFYPIIPKFTKYLSKAS